jgi:hypothetical protein
MSSPRQPMLNQLGNVYAHYDTILRLTYQYYVRSLPLSERLSMCSMLLQCFCLAPSVLAVWNHGHLNEYSSWYFRILQSDRVPYPIQRARFYDLPQAGQQRYPTVLTLPDRTDDDFFIECLVLPLWHQQHYGGHIELYASRLDRWSDDPQAVQFLGDLSNEIAAILIDPEQHASRPVSTVIGQER